jgi:hypothetical protein
LGLIPPAGVALVFAVVVGWDRIRAPHPRPPRPFAVVDPRIYRDAQRRIERLLAAGDPIRPGTSCTPSAHGRGSKCTPAAVPGAGQAPLRWCSGNCGCSKLAVTTR